MPLLRRLTSLLWVEAAALVGLGLGYGGSSASRDGDHRPAVLAAVGALRAGVAQAVCARALGRGRSWARSPAVVLNIFPLPLALGAVRAGAGGGGGPRVVLAGALQYQFATPELREELRER